MSSSFFGGKIKFITRAIFLNLVAWNVMIFVAINEPKPVLGAA